MINLASRTVLALLTIFSAAGCAIQGDRAGSGVCPDGETCSDQAPSGLFFLGAATTDSLGGSVGVTAVGGTQVLTVHRGQELDSATFDMPFDAKSTELDVVAVSSVDPPRISITGASAGTAMVRALEPGTDKLLDRVSVSVAKIDKVTLLPSELFAIEPEDTTWALLAGGTAPLIVRLAAADGVRLVDESLTLTSPSGLAKREAWDTFALVTPASGEVKLAITAGSQPFDATAPVVAALDDIVPSTYLSALNSDDKLEVLQSALNCFVARSGGVTAAGATWKFTGSANLELEPTSTEENTLTHTLTSCIQVKGTAVGPATLTVDASGFSKTFTVNVVKKMARSAQRKDAVAASRPLRTASPGERAGGI